MLLEHIDRFCQLIVELTTRIEGLTVEQAPAELLGASRFRSEACYAMNAGVAPIPVWSANTAGRVRLNRGGNRQLNAALHRIAITQVRLGGLGKAYYNHRRANGDSLHRGLPGPETPPRTRRLKHPHPTRITRCDLPSTGRLT